jgi:hypothetical protein
MIHASDTRLATFQGVAAGGVRGIESDFEFDSDFDFEIETEAETYPDVRSISGNGV